MTTTSAPVGSVIQSDRDKAADMWRAIGRASFADWQPDWMRDGTSDHGPVVQAFAAYRVQIEQSSRVGEGDLDEASEIAAHYSYPLSEVGKKRLNAALANPPLALVGDVRDALIEVLKRIDDGIYPSLDDQANAVLAALQSSPSSHVVADTPIYGWVTHGGTVYSGEGYPVPWRKFHIDRHSCASLLLACDPPEPAAPALQAGEE